MTKALAVVVLAGVAGTAVAFAESSRAQLAVSVTVVRACAVDTRADNDAPVLRLTCSNGAQTTLRVSESAQLPSTTISSEGSTLLTLNF